MSKEGIPQYGEVTNEEREAAGSRSRGNQVFHFPANAGKAGATAGWAFANNNGAATLPAAQTASTLVIPLELKAGDVITGFTVSGQIESAGATATLDADLRATTAAAADLTDASIGAITQVSVTADTLVAASKTGLSETVASGKSYYILLTGTTAAATDVALQGVEVTITQK